MNSPPKNHRNYDDRGIRALAEAIIAQAAKDYRIALRVLRVKPDNRRATGMIQSLENFFRSGWFEVLSPLRGDWLMRKLRESEARPSLKGQPKHPAQSDSVHSQQCHSEPSLQCHSEQSEESSSPRKGAL